MEFSKSQIKAYEAKDSNVLVSAGAGSGKTAVLSERVKYLVEKHNYKIEDFLVLTFTNLAAEEMKQRIRKKLMKIGSEEANKVDNAYICTFDSFSLNILKKYHYLLNISKDISVIDNVALKVYVYDLIDVILERDIKNNKTLQGLATLFIVKDSKDLKKFIYEVYEKASGASDTQAYLNNLLQKTLSDCFNNYYEDFKRFFYSIVEEFRYNYENNDCGQKYISEADALMEKYDNVMTFDEKVDIMINNKLPRSTFKDEEAKLIHNKVKNALAEISKYHVPNDELVSEFENAKEYTKYIVDIINEIIIKTDKYKDELQCYTFSDIAKKSIELFKSHPEICDELKNRFKTIMIDEYQDTSQLQEDFISLISNNNVYMVGDVKQSIYRFRKAVPKLFIDKFNNYQKGNGGQLICLSDNYRSRSEVLHDINILFSEIMSDTLGGANYKRDHIISPGNIFYDKYRGEGQNNNFEQLVYESKDAPKDVEMRLIAEDIIKKVNNGYKVFDMNDEGPYLRNVKYSDFCILIDRGTSFPTFQKIFNEYGIPLFVQNNVDISKKTVTSVIKNLLLITHCIIEKDYKSARFNHAFVSIMRSFVFDYDDEIILNYLDNGNACESALVRTLIDIYSQKELEGPYAYIFEVVKQLKIYDKLVRIGDIRMHEKYLDSFLATLKNLNNQGYSLDDFSHYFDMILEKEMKIDVPSSSTEFDSVKLMNIHKSKGLEFPIVYIAQMNVSFNRMNFNPNYYITDEMGIIYPTRRHGKNLMHFLYKRDELVEDISEKIRLFYVQLTRAKEKVIFICPKSVKQNILDDTKKMHDLLAPAKEFFTLTEVFLNEEFVRAKLDNVNVDEEILYHRDIEIEDELIDVKRASKKLSFNSVKSVLEYGEKMHLYLELIDFHNPDYAIIESFNEKKKIQQFIESDLIRSFKNPRYFKEYEFIDGINHTRGFIDLLVIDDDGAHIIDYKLKNIDDDMYKQQLQTYRNFVKVYFNLESECYLYSIIDGKYQHIEVEKIQFEELFESKN